jgi:acyl-CoA synthetase (AMP-forming)/AMP-acid ligase II
MVFRSSFPDVDIPDWPVHELILRGLVGKADRPALIDGVSGITVTFGELAAAIDRVAAALAERGIRKGDVIGIFGPNSPAYAIAFHGVMRAGAVATTINVLYPAEEVATQLTDAGAKLLFTVSAFLERANSAAERAGISEVIVFDKADGHVSLSDLLATVAPAPQIEFDPGEDLAVLPYSSGTTGRAKGVMLTHRALVANIVQTDSIMDVSGVTRVFAVLPFFHIYGMQVTLNHALFAGATVVTMPRFDLTEFLRIIAEYRIDRVYIAPPIAVALAKHPVVDNYDLSTVRTLFSGAAPLDEELAEAVHKRLGCKVRQGYGMTEMSPVSHAIPDDRDDIEIGTVGLIMPNMENKIVDIATGEEVGVGERGELWCKGPNVMKGYLNNDEATAATLDEDGFLHTGDVAVIDERGVVTIVDRVKELIKYKGYQVPPAELEALLLTHPQIADAAVIGVHDDEGEEVPKAFVVLQAGAEDVTAETVMAFVAERVAPHKKVRVVEFLDAIPKSSSGKILRKDLRAREKVAK